MQPWLEYRQRRLWLQEAAIAWLKLDRATQTLQTDQPLGGYCQGAEIDNCRRYFGDGLAQVCSTCPN